MEPESRRAHISIARVMLTQLIYSPPFPHPYDCTTYAQNERQHAVAATRPAPRPSQGVSRSGAAGNPTGAAATGAAPTQPSAMRVAHEARAQRARDAQRAAQDAHAALVGSHNFERPKSNRYIDQQSAPGFEAPSRAREIKRPAGGASLKSRVSDEATIDTTGGLCFLRFG